MKVRVAPGPLREAVVAATDPRRIWLWLGLVALVMPLRAAVLPEERADALYHAYDGGGIEVSGPSLLVRKQFGQNWSVFGNYYVDSISSASIDVVTTASPYKEERTEKSLGVDYLRDKTMLSASLSNSQENDFEADTFSFGVSQDFFGDLTTLSIGYSQGDDEVRRRGDDDFRRDVERRQYRLGLTQVLTRNLIMGFNYEGIADEGYLNNPYRQVRFVDANLQRGYDFESERYPNTRSSDAFALRARYHLPYRAAVSGEYRWFSDTWGIDANTLELGYTQPFRQRWMMDLRLRFYDQTAASFYGDLFPFSDAQAFLARDKELSTFSSRTLGAGVSYEFDASEWRHIERGSFNLSLDHIRFEYDDFSDLRGDPPLGSESLYSFSANVLQLFFSIWY